MKLQPVILIHNLNTYIGDTWIHRNLNLTIFQGEIMGLVGGSGSGKTTLMRTILGLQQAHSGKIVFFGHDIFNSSLTTLLNIKKRCGVLFQHSALFSSLTIIENIEFPLKEYTKLNQDTIRELALLKLQLVGLRYSDMNKYPAELSGGMLKRASLARALAMDPEIIFLDEPTAGLDPHSTSSINKLIATLQDSMGITIVMITHDLSSLKQITQRIAFLGEGQVLCTDTVEAVFHHTDPLIKNFFMS